MIRSATYRLLQHSSASFAGLRLPTPFIRFSAEASSTPPPPQDPVIPTLQETPVHSKVGDDGADHKKRNPKTNLGGGYAEEQARVLRAALSHVPKLGWSESAMISGARDVGVSPSIVGSFPRREAALVEFFMDDCLQRLTDRIDSGEELNSLILSDRLTKLIRTRLEMQARPMNLPTSLKQRAFLVDEVWHAAGDQGSDVDWYVKRTVLGGIYSTCEVYMITDRSSDFCDSWNFLEHRVRDAFDLKKTLQENFFVAAREDL
ncbi:hypothetical protein AXF42_Ash015034 [Apostasia shenzhenica]|uniref:Ubiquinone biosynthesis protein n=1 Tax=Apostasia shenzhenica TaxID=1088818 RepID=A0A2I0B2X8_9ASPA|nr:hypothetical protein AXF42_Ash015034 [Apostasia shenzhenica]